VPQVGAEDVLSVLSSLLEAPLLPAGGAVLEVAGTGVDAGSVQGQLAVALASINEKNAEKNAARAAEQREAPARPAAKSPIPFAFGRVSVVGVWGGGHLLAYVGMSVV
jgi:hypothetical protein